MAFCIFCSSMVQNRSSASICLVHTTSVHVVYLTAKYDMMKNDVLLSGVFFVLLKIIFKAILSCNVVRSVLCATRYACHD